MKALAIIFIGLAAASLGSDISSYDYLYDHDSSEYLSEEIEERVADGIEMPIFELSKFNYQVGMYILHPEDEFEICGGSIIHPEIILSAAHCFREGYLYVGIFMGKIVRPKDINSTDVIVYPDDITVHNNFAYGSVFSDIALIKLPAPVQLSKYVGVIALAPPDFDCRSGVGWVSGWGKIRDDGFLPEIMHYGEANSTHCPFDQTEQSRICSSTIQLKNVCQGDSGGSFAFEDGNGGRYSCGINSYKMDEKCLDNTERVHTSVQYFRDNGWICDNSGRLVGCDI